MLYANTDDGSSAIWVLDDDGVVIDNISINGAERAPILEQINEHYGTSFTGWSDNEIGLRFGDPLPNWDAFEKIFVTIKYKVKPPSSPYWAIGEMKDNKFYLYVAEKPQFGNCGVDDKGKVTMVFLNIEILFNQIWKPALNAIGISIDTYETKFEYNVGVTIEDWADYIAI